MRALKTTLSRRQSTRILGWSRGRNEFKLTYKPLKHCLLDFTQVAFWGCQGEGNEFPVPGDHLKHRFLDLIKVEFLSCQEAEIEIKFHSTT